MVEYALLLMTVSMYAFAGLTILGRVVNNDFNQVNNALRCHQAAACAPAPTVTSVSPSSGPIAGGTTVTITGTSFTGATVVNFGGTAASSYTVNSATQITATSPAESAGSVDITVSTPAGTSTTSGADRFTFNAPAPAVTGVSPSSGSTSGGTTVTITGTNFTGATAVNFGGSAASSYTVNSDTQITATSPAESAGVVDITVTTPSGTSATSGADRYTFTVPPPPAPIVTSVSPNNGPTAGGTSVTIWGGNFTAATLVAFGGTAAAYTVVSDTQITATSPPEAAATVDVRVTTSGGTSATSSADQFTYNATGAFYAITGDGASGHIWAAGDQSIIYKGPGAYQPENGPNAGPNFLYGISCPSSTLCFAVGYSGEVLTTTNGGSSWTSIAVFTGAQLNGIACPSTTVCFVASDNGGAYSTSDGGATWSFHYWGDPNIVYSGVACPSTTVCYVIANHSKVGGSVGIVEKTSNGGSTWTNVNTGFGLADSISCPSTTVCVTSGSGGGIEYTTNGTSWNVAVSGTGADLLGIACPTTTVCYTAGTSGTILKSTDGGATWAALSSGTTARLSGIYCTSTTACWAAGATGASFVGVIGWTSNGTSWTWTNP